MTGRMAPPLGLGLAGCGNFGTFCLAAAADLADTVVVAVTDVEPNRASALAATYDARAVRDLDALLAADLVDAVRGGRPPRVSGNDACDSLATALGAQQAAGMGHSFEPEHLQLRSLA